MQFVVISFLVLALSELPVLHAKKVVVVMKHQLRRTPSPPWRHLAMMHGKKNQFSDHTFPGHPRHGHPHGPQFYRSKDLQFAKEQYPQGGDDFDQGHEDVNHVIVPHGKGITHAVSFGKGYIPFDTYKDRRPSVSHHHDYKVSVPMAQDIQYSPTMHYSSRPSYAQAYISQQADSYLRNQNTNQDELQDRIQDRGAQKYVTEKSLYDSSNAGANGPHYGVVQNIQAIPNNKPIFLTSGIPQGNLGPTEQSIILRDSIVMDDYHRKVAELTKNWPSNFVKNNFIPGNPGHQGSPQHFGLSRQFDGQHDISQGISGGTSFVSALGQAQNQQGYAVKEDVVDTPHDFRTMPIQTGPAQQPIQHQTIQQIYQQQHPVPQIIHQQQLQQQPLEQIIQQPVQQSLQHISPQLQIPVNYGLQNYQGLVHG